MPGFPQGHDPTLHAQGLTGRSLISAAGEVWLPFDAVRHPAPPALQPLREVRVRHAPDTDGMVDWSRRGEVHVINGMGVALGDNIVGLSVIAALKARHPQLRFHLHHAAYLPTAVRELHDLAEGRVARFSSLPCRLDAIPADATLIDIGDFAYWRQFSSMAMVDFFAWALGMPAADLDPTARRNGWLDELALPALPAPWHSAPYALLAPRASTPLRHIPDAVCGGLVESIRERYAVPVLGFAELEQPGYHPIGGLSRTTAEFLAWIANAAILISADSAAVHVAAGFGVPTVAGFVSIDPALRTAGYPHCRAIDLRQPGLDGLHHSDEPHLVRRAHAAWTDFAATSPHWPAPRR